MKFFQLAKDGGAESRVHGFFFVEIKRLFSVVLLRFADGSRDAYHSHAFNAKSWVLKGKLVQNELTGAIAGPDKITEFTPSIKPIDTPKSMFHKVVSKGNTWVLSFRGPWADQWQEFLPSLRKFVTLTHGRKVVA